MAMQRVAMGSGNMKEQDAKRIGPELGSDGEPETRGVSEDEGRPRSDGARRNQGQGGEAQ